jgi:uncharacterized OB-fold protein
MTRADDPDRSPMAGDADRGNGLKLPRAFCPVCGTVWDDPRERCPNTAAHPPVPVGDRSAGE